MLQLVLASRSGLVRAAVIREGKESQGLLNVRADILVHSASLTVVRLYLHSLKAYTLGVSPASTYL
jgi:hypothetical protein